MSSKKFNRHLTELSSAVSRNNNMVKLHLGSFRHSSHVILGAAAAAVVLIIMMILYTFAEEPLCPCRA